MQSFRRGGIAQVCLGLGVSAVAMATMASGCADEEATSNAAVDPMTNGEMVYTTPLSSSSSFTCSSCHALQEPARDGIRRPGHPIGDATRRATWKNGEVDSFLAAANSCRVEWMNTTEWAADDKEYLALFEFLEETADAQGVAPGQADPITIDIAAPPADAGGGDPAAGQALFNESCIICHGQDAAGTLRGPPLAGRELALDYIVNRVRTSGRANSAVYDGLTGGVMPFWGANRLSDQEVLDLAAFVNGSEAQPDPMVTPPPDPEPVVGECDATHPKVGWVAPLSTIFHQVSGQARIVDDCNIVLENFDYDGAGIDVRAWVAPNGDYSSGVPIGPQLLKPDGYMNAKVMLGLGDGVSLDDVDGISIWCVTVGVSFGDGLFAPPSP